MKKNIRVGILGCAQIARRYAIPAFLSMPGVTLVAIASRDRIKAETWAEEFSIEAESYDSLIRRTDIDVIYSPLPIGLQEEWVTHCARAGKHVIVEKSASYSYESVLRMVAICKEYAVGLYENFVPEFHTQHERVLSLIKKGELGTVRVLNASYGFPPFPPDDIRYRLDLHGGSLNDAGCYTVFMARKILAQEPVAVTCALSCEGKEVDIHGSALLEFDGAQALLSFGFDNVYQNTYSVWGSKGLVRVLRAFAIPPDLPTTIDQITNDGKGECITSITVDAENQFTKSFTYFCDVVASGAESTREELYARVLAQAKVLEAMRISAREGRRVEVKEV
jgi:dTDP-3,4-didehydro-2,6-dideoxy-alpha-D-glucose 3-reductase